MSEAPHLSVLLDEVVEAMAPAEGRRLVDATFGAGGYTRAFLEKGASVVAFDRDPSAARFAAPLAAEFPGRFTLIQRRFSELEAGLAEAGLQACDGVAFDLGVSSMQLDEAERGFSFMRDGPLDMRMGEGGPSAADLVNTMDETELAHLIWTLGDERGSRKIAKYIVNRRADRPFERTLDLAFVVEKALGGRKGAPVHPATRTFQALRIAVNEELEEVSAGLRAAEAVLAPGGRLAVVTFHSLEDRIAKSFLAERAGKTPAGSRHLPPTQLGPAPSFELLFNGARAPSEAETARNPRARSAKLRAATRTAAPAWRLAA
jgi:16S rRNA (cytosine1402-N4)-methyltransferase